MESFGLKQNTDSALEQESLDIEEGIKRERTTLEKFRGKAKDIARVLLFVSALSAGAVMNREAYAEEKLHKPTAQSEHLSAPEQKRLEYLQQVILDEEVDKLIIRTNEIGRATIMALEKYNELAEKSKPTNTMRAARAGLIGVLDKTARTMGHIQDINKQAGDIKKSKDIEITKAAMKKIEETNSTLYDMEKELINFSERLSAQERF